MAGCADEKLSPNSVITADKRTPTPLDLWLDRYYVSTYNINFKYRYEDIESDMKYYTVPASYQMAIKMANLVKYSCLEAFDEVAGPDFTKANFPKLIYLTGNWEYKNNGTFILGTAEGGKKILLAGTNFIDKFIQSAEDINTYYLKTVYHEFTHILNQTKPYSADFKLVTGSGYVADKWSESPYANTNYCYEHGFISAYAQHSDVEDFAEMFSIYVTSSPKKWNAWLDIANAKGQKDNILTKLDYVRNYMRESWNIDIDKLRDVYLQERRRYRKGKGRPHQHFTITKPNAYNNEENSSYTFGTADARRNAGFAIVPKRPGRRVRQRIVAAPARVSRQNAENPSGCTLWVGLRHLSRTDTGLWGIRLHLKVRQREMQGAERAGRKS